MVATPPAISLSFLQHHKPYHTQQWIYQVQASFSSGKITHIRRSMDVNKHFFFLKNFATLECHTPVDLSSSIETNKAKKLQVLMETLRVFQSHSIKSP